MASQPLAEIVQQDLSRGSNLVTNPYDIGRQQSILLTNLVLAEHGSLTTRDGSIAQTTAPDLRPIIKLFDYIQPDGTIIKLAIVLGSATNNQLYNRGTTPWTLIGTLGTKETLPDILSFVGKALIINGYEVPYQYDGTTLSHITDTPGTGSVPPGAKHHTLHQGFYWLWNTNTISGTGSFAALTTAFVPINSNLIFTARTPGTGGNAITVEYTNDGAATPFSVSVVGSAITVHLAVNGGGVITSTGQDVMDGVNVTPAAAALVTVTLAPGNDGSGLVAVLAPTNLSGGTGTSASIYDGPSSLRSSDINDPDSWPLANQIFIDKDDGDFGNGMGQFTIAESGISPTTSQILFKQFAAYQMTGVFGSTNPAFSIQKVKSDMGCVAPRTIRFAPGFGLLRLSHRGIALFNGVEDTLVSEEVRPLIFGSDTFTGIDWNYVSRCQAEVVANPPLYVLFAPTQGAALTRCFCYDLVRKAWTILQFSTSVATVQAIRDPNTLPTVLIGDYDQGHVRSIFNPVAVAEGYDGTTAIQWSARLRPAAVSSPQVRGYFHAAIVKLFGVAEGQTIFWSVIFGPVTSSTVSQKNGTITIPANVPATIPVGGYGEAPYGGPPYGAGAGSGPSSEVDVTIGLGLLGTNARLTLSGQGHVVIRGIDWLVKPKPLVRPSVYV